MPLFVFMFTWSCVSGIWLAVNQDYSGNCQCLSFILFRSQKCSVNNMSYSSFLKFLFQNVWNLPDCSVFQVFVIMLRYINMYSNITNFLCRSVILKRNMIFVSNFMSKTRLQTGIYQTVVHLISDCLRPQTLSCYAASRTGIWALKLLIFFKVVKGSKFLKMEKEILFHFQKFLYLKQSSQQLVISVIMLLYIENKNGLQDRFGHFKYIWKYAHCTDSYSCKCSEQISTSISQQLLWSTFIITALHCRRTWQWCWIIMV